MPSNKYTCGQCGHVLEVHQPAGAEAWRDCPACAQPALQRRDGALLQWFGAGAFGFGAGDGRSAGSRESAGVPAGEVSR
jgi:putative FmdB family regulatory protein